MLVEYLLEIYLHDCVVQASYEFNVLWYLTNICLFSGSLAQASLLEFLPKVRLCTDLQENWINPFNMK